MQQEGNSARQGLGSGSPVKRQTWLQTAGLGLPCQQTDTAPDGRQAGVLADHVLCSALCGGKR